MSAQVDAALYERLLARAAEWTGFSRDAILPDAIRRAGQKLLAEAGSAAELSERLERADLGVVHALCQAVSVGETYFFRHPEHFQFVSRVIVPQLVEQKEAKASAWSAGCATGEETYSIAACLLDTLRLLGSNIPVEVLGTDLLERNLVTARNAAYGTWSRRPSAPTLHPIFVDETPDGRVKVDPRVRAAVRFQIHNLLEPAPGGPFDVIFCRNVLVYFAPESIQTVVRNLTAALKPGGVMMFGSMDVTLTPPGLVQEGAPELQIFRKPDPARQPKPLPVAKKPLPPQPVSDLPRAPRVRALEPVALHLRALQHIERGDKKVAEKELADLVAKVPDYIPGLLERALLHVRAGERSAAASLMREVLRRTEKLPQEDLLPGPEPLPVSFYRDSAETFLRRGVAQ